MKNCPVEIISLTPRFNAVACKRANEKPFKRFFSARTFRTRLKPGVNETRKMELQRQCVSGARRSRRFNVQKHETHYGTPSPLALFTLKRRERRAPSLDCTSLNNDKFSAMQ